MTDQTTIPPEGMCTLGRTIAIAPGEQLNQEIDLGTITKITRSQSAQLTDFSLIVKSADDRFVMDMGVSETITLEFTRVNPPEPDNSGAEGAAHEPLPQTADVSKKWSNAQYMGQLRKFLDVWQNNTYSKYSVTTDDEGVTHIPVPHIVGGFRLKYIPEDNARGNIPEIDRNVFVSGQVEWDRGRVIRSSITFVSARMDIGRPLFSVVRYWLVTVYGTKLIKHAGYNTQKISQNEGATVYRLPEVEDVWSPQKYPRIRSWRIGESYPPYKLMYKGHQKEIGQAGSVWDPFNESLFSDGVPSVIDIGLIKAPEEYNPINVWTYDYGVDGLEPGDYIIWIVGGGGYGGRLADRLGSNSKYITGTAGAPGEIIRQDITIEEGERGMINWHIGGGGIHEEDNTRESEKTDLTYVIMGSDGERRETRTLIARGGASGADGDERWVGTNKYVSDSDEQSTKSDGIGIAYMDVFAFAEAESELRGGADVIVPGSMIHGEIIVHNSDGSVEKIDELVQAGESREVERVVNQYIDMYIQKRLIPAQFGGGGISCPVVGKNSNKWGSHGARGIVAIQKVD